MRRRLRSNPLRSPRWVALGVAVLLVGGSALLAPQAGARGQPSAVLSQSVVSPGQSISLTVTGLPPEAPYSVQVCGQNAQSSSDCELNSSVTVSSGPTGQLDVNTLGVTMPPVPCPCVVALYSDPTLNLVDRFPIQIVGAPSAPVPNQAKLASHLVILGTQIEGSTRPAEWFGASGKRTLAVTVANTGHTAAPSLNFVLYVGGTPDPVPTHVGLQPQQKRTYRIPITVPALTFGTLHVDGRVTDGDGSFTGFQDSQLWVPWGLVIVGLILLQLIALSWRNRARRRNERKQRARAAAAGAGLAAGAGVTGGTAQPGDEAVEQAHAPQTDEVSTGG